ncbi:hypothetical protein F511_37250 [Dorcoceras hygrometricum]|uniref:Secreted protein n=1 Tax=Dorcoceras hygrometricum TaxID=472368 RepID=A0A2Z7A457_9LAMI|nr:hypothetical protein F511_37250 [Dorcoceras hygrometricum]
MLRLVFRMLRLVVRCSYDWYYARSCCVWIGNRELWSMRVSAPVLATGTRRGKHCALFCLATGYPAAGSMRRRLDKLVRRRFEDQSMVCLRYFQPFVPYLLNPRTLFNRELSGDFPSFPVVVLLVRGYSAGRSADPARGAPGDGIWYMFMMYRLLSTRPDTRSVLGAHICSRTLRYCTSFLSDQISRSFDLLE